jgi:hypothetical protein
MPENLAAQRDGTGDAADSARVRLASLQVDAEQAYAAITAADAALRVLAERRVAAERVARHAAARHAAAARAAGTCARARPGLLAQLASRLRARARWRAEVATRQAALAGTQLPLAGARRALAQARDEFTAQVQARAGAVTELRRLTAECAEVQQELVACGEHAVPRRRDRDRPPASPGAAPDETTAGG